MSDAHHLLQALFQANQGPEIVDLITEGEVVSLTLFIPDNLSWFQGHFLGQPVLPGVVQVDWAIKLGKALFPALEQFTGIKHVKFKKMLLPEMFVMLQLTHRSIGKLSFQYQQCDDLRAVLTAEYSATQSFSQSTLGLASFKVTE